MKKEKGCHLTEYGVVFSVGALGYGGLELLWRGNTHWTMLVAGGMCLCGIYRWHAGKQKPALWRCGLVSGAIITGFEFLAGVIVNLWLHWDVWDYSQFRVQLLGQICLVYSALWCLLGVPLHYLCLGLHGALAGGNKRPSLGRRTIK